jgi:hypothetical protein
MRRWWSRPHITCEAGWPPTCRGPELGVSIKWFNRSTSTGTKKRRTKAVARCQETTKSAATPRQVKDQPLTRTLAMPHHPTGTHYTRSLPRSLPIPIPSILCFTPRCADEASLRFRFYLRQHRAHRTAGSRLTHPHTLIRPEFSSRPTAVSLFECLGNASMHTLTHTVREIANIRFTSTPV